MPNDRFSCAGFSLLEALISLAILSGVITAGLIQFVSGQRALKRAEATYHITRDAEEIIGRIGLDIPLRTGQWNGRTESGSSWNLTIKPYRQEGADIKSLLDVRLQLQSADTPQVEFATLKRIVR